MADADAPSLDQQLSDAAHRRAVEYHHRPRWAARRDAGMFGPRYWAGDTTWTGTRSRALRFVNVMELDAAIEAAYGEDPCNYEWVRLEDV